MSVNTFDKNNGDLTPLSKLYQIESGDEVGKLFEEMTSLKTQVESNTEKISELENSKSVMSSGMAFTIAYGAISSSITGKATIEEGQG